MCDHHLPVHTAHYTFESYHITRSREQQHKATTTEQTTEQKNKQDNNLHTNEDDNIAHSDVTAADQYPAKRSVCMSATILCPLPPYIPHRCLA
ncbi:hypothetical protein DOY81_005085 [Sarcophaga bullata]|nr:hypothetical protein DOY81_005085 [Sarcophaga bullata]